MTPFLAALATFITPLINYAEGKLASIGAAFLGGVGAILNAFTNDQRAIGANVIAFWQAKYHEALAVGGTSEISAIEHATTAALNEFAAEEGSEMGKVAGAVISLLEISVTNSLKL
jgi:hypothetical protein